MKISTEIGIRAMLFQYGFFDKSMHINDAFENDFVDNNDGTVTDRVTGLMWQKSGSSNTLENRYAKRYIKQLNRDRFAGDSDWRMATIEELASLVKRKKEMVFILPRYLTNCRPPVGVSISVIHTMIHRIEARGLLILNMEKSEKQCGATWEELPGTI